MIMRWWIHISQSTTGLHPVLSNTNAENTEVIWNAILSRMASRQGKLNLIAPILWGVGGRGKIAA